MSGSTLRRRITRTAAVIVATAAVAAPGTAVAHWTVPEGCWLQSQGTQFADVTGDGKADAIAVGRYFITVKQSDGTRFGPSEVWTAGPYYGSIGTYFADVTGDGRAAAIAVNAEGVTVRRSDGTRFLPNETWSAKPYYGSIGTYFADVTGDGRADAIAVNGNRSPGVLVRRSDGSRFASIEAWTSGPFFGTVATLFADVTGDGLADGVAFDQNGGVIVRRPNGDNAGAFGPAEQWTAGPYHGSHGTFLADVNGDGAADAVANTASGVAVRRSDTVGFLGHHWWTTNPYYGDVGTYFADVTGDGRADAIVVNSGVGSVGVVVRRSDGSRFTWNERWTDGSFYGDAHYSCIN